MLKRTLVITATIGLVLSGVAGNAASKAKEYSPSSGPYSRCDSEKNLKGQALAVQEYLESVHNCVTANRVVNSKLPTQKPKTKLSPGLAFSQLDKCKLVQPSNLSTYRGFPAGSDPSYFAKRHPGAGSIIQIIGVSATDAPASKGTPSQDYKYYLDRFKDWLSNVNNSGEPVTLRVSDKWFNYGAPLTPLGISHRSFNQTSRNFGGNVIQLADPEIDFSGVDYVIVVVPAGTPLDVIGQNGLGEQNTNEGQIRNVSIVMPATFEKFKPNDFGAFLNITMWIHELYHPGFNMGDQPGDGRWLVRGTQVPQDKSDLATWPFENRGMGEWGMFANGTTDMLQWQKWLLGFTTDSQVKCAPTDATTFTWLAPGSTKTSKQKMVVVPISTTEAIVVESVRATGLNYKLQKFEQGALVYTIDMTKTTYDYGYDVQFPDARHWKSMKHSMDTAPFKKGESFTYKGVKITNVEWGDFGDVIKVEPVK